MKFSILPAIVALVSFQASLLGEQRPLANTEPGLQSVSPIGGRQGTTFEVEVRGRALERASAAWFECNDLKATLKKVEEVKQESVAKESKEKTYGSAQDSKQGY